MNNDLWEKVYIAFSIEEILKLEFQDVDFKADNIEPPVVQ